MQRGRHMDLVIIAYMIHISGRYGRNLVDLESAYCKKMLLELDWMDFDAGWIQITPLIAHTHTHTHTSRQGQRLFLVRWGHRSRFCSNVHPESSIPGLCHLLTQVGRWNMVCSSIQPVLKIISCWPDFFRFREISDTAFAILQSNISR